MKRLQTFGILLLAMLLFAACQKEDFSKQWQSAIITSYDVALCACCGGTMITLSEDPDPRAEDFYRWEQQEDIYDFLKGKEYPIYVKMKFDTITENCVDFNWIDVIDMKLDE